jgi:hypothetical protein
MTGWKKRFEDLVQEIGGHPMLQLDAAEIRPPATDADIERATKAAGGALPTGLAEVYRELNGMRLQWSVRDASAFTTDEPPAGAIDLLPIIRDRGESVYGSWKDTVWFSETDKFRHVVPFDMYTPEACAAFYPVGGETIVHDHYMGESLASTGRTFLQYLELLFKARGYLYWPTSLCEEEQDSTAVEDFRVNFPKLFGEDTNAFGPL